MAKCPKCGYVWKEEPSIETKRKLVVKKVPKGEAIGCLYCFNCEKFGWGDNKCYWCGSTDVGLYSKHCGILEYKKTHPDENR